MPPKQPAVSLGDVASSILDAPLPSGGITAPILAKRKGPEKRLAEAKAEEGEAAAVARAKKALKGSAHLVLKNATSTSQDPILESKLKKTATQGVVALFNAVRNAQKTDDPTPVKSKDRRRKRDDVAGADGEAANGVPARAAESKDSFLDILRRGSAGGSSAGGRQKQPTAAHALQQGSGAAFLRDDFMLGRTRARDFGRDDDEIDGGDIEFNDQGADIDDDL